jgi:beta-galactosidase
MVRPAILHTIFLTAFLTLGCEGCSSGATPPAARSDSLLADGWRFVRRDVPAARSPDFDDSAWQSIALPHTWNNLDGQDGGDNYYRGPGWYRRHFSIAPGDEGKEVFLRFEAASLAADVYVNGQFAGHHAGGFSAFCFDVTSLVHSGENVLAVRVDNSSSPDIPPVSGDFTICGGLYRNVHLLVTDKVHISPLDDASPGVYLKPEGIGAESAGVNISLGGICPLLPSHCTQGEGQGGGSAGSQDTATPESAVVSARAVLRNDSDENATIAVRFEVFDAANRKVCRAEVSQAISAHGDADASADLTIPSPHLWDGLCDPYLYHARVDVLQNGMLLDRVVQPLGLRTYRVDAQRGFFLNGRSYPLHGVAVHQDFFNRGWAITPGEIDQSYDLIREIGANTVRLAHYQHPEYEYSLCDRLGVVVWAEACLVNRINDTPGFGETCRQQVRELIKQNYNHPSICFWSLFNELGPRTRTDWRLVHELNDIAHTIDPDRVTVAASHLPAEIPLNQYPDIIGFNRYFGWYTDTIAAWPTELDKLHAALPDTAIGISEYGAGASIRQHEQPTTQPVTKGHWHPEEWQSTVHEAAWRAMQQRPWLWGTFIWNMFDFASDARNEGDTPGMNDKGLVTADRKIRKDAFYFYKANWSNEPFVHICEQRWNPRPAGQTQIKVYSNCQSVRLFLSGCARTTPRFPPLPVHRGRAGVGVVSDFVLTQPPNGVFLGTRCSSDHVFVWDQVSLSPGSCVVTAVGDGNIRDDCSWAIAKAATRPASRASTRE